MTLAASAARGARIGALLLTCAAPAAFAAPQDGGVPTVSRPVVQSTTRSPSDELTAALLRVSRNPRDVDALVDAGRAALRLGDTDAALGFFRRADEVSPGNAAIKAQIGSALVRGDKPVEALGWFDQAERAGGDTASFASDRGLAYDLVGDNGLAQRWYQVALARNPSTDEVRLRYALSLAIAGNQRAAESLLAPLIQQQDRSAWRVRTFIMAIAGREDEAVSIAHATMPADLADGISPYLRYMPRLTKAQQAAAANFGRFPRAADIGRDDATVREYAVAHPPAATVGAGLVPSGEPLGAGTALASNQKVSRERRRRPGRGGEEDKARLASAQPGQIPALPAQQQQSQQQQAQAPSRTASSGGELPALPQREPMRVADAARGNTPASTFTPTPAPAPAPAPGFASVDRSRGEELSALDRPAPGSTPAPTSAFARPTVSTPTPTPAPAPTPAPVPAPKPTITLPSTPAPQPGFDLARVGQPSQPVREAAASPAPTPVIQPIPATTAANSPGDAAPTNAAPVDFSAAFDSFRPPASERREEVAAVDLNKIEPTRGPSPEELRAAARAKAARDKAEAEARAAKAKADAEAKKQRELEKANPARVWVQVATGANRGWMDEEWRKIEKQAPEVLRKHSPYVTPWNRVYRLLTGPFKTEDAARDVLNQLKKQGIDGFIFNSDAGEVVDKVAVKK